MAFGTGRRSFEPAGERPVEHITRIKSADGMREKLAKGSATDAETAVGLYRIL